LSHLGTALALLVCIRVHLCLKTKIIVDKVQHIPVEGQFTLSAVALAKADPGASKGKLEIKTETGVEPRTPSEFNKSHHSAASSTS
jgi:hypothetical protein